jgi:hypothetical protein
MCETSHISHASHTERRSWWPPLRRPRHAPEKETRMFSPDRIARLRGQLDTGRRRLDTARSYTGRAATVLGAGAATTGLFTQGLYGESLLATAAATGLGVAVLPTWKAVKFKEVKVRTEHHNGFSVSTEKEPTHQARTARLLYAAPGAALLGILTAEQIVPGFHWGEALALAVWSAGTWWLRPGRAARHMLVPPLPPLETTGDLVVQEQPDVGHDHPAAQWWAEQVGVEGGIVPGTVLEDITRTGEQAMRGIIRAVVPGQPVPPIKDTEISRLSALMDVPEDLIKVGPVPGRGASVRQLAIGEPDAGALDAETFWATRIAPLAMPGARIAAINFGRMTVDMTKENA